MELMFPNLLCVFVFPEKSCIMVYHVVYIHIYISLIKPFQYFPIRTSHVGCALCVLGVTASAGPEIGESGNRWGDGKVMARI